jgi:hypothetical protein
MASAYRRSLSWWAGTLLVMVGVLLGAPAAGDGWFAKEAARNALQPAGSAAEGS